MFDLTFLFISLIIGIANVVAYAINVSDICVY